MSDFDEAEAPVQRVRAAIDVKHVEAHRLALASCLVEYGPDQSASDAAALMARQQFNKPDESLLVAVVDVQPADVHAVGTATAMGNLQMPSPNVTLSVIKKE